MDVIYLPRETLERDNIFGEDIRAKFQDDYLIEMYFDSVDGFEGDGNFLANFGMQIKDTATLVVSKRRFEETISNKIRPMEGDLIYFPLANAIFEVNFVEHENPFYQLGKLYTYKLTVELFTYNNEEFNTGDPTIDSIMDDFSIEKEIEPADNEELQVEADIIVIEHEPSQPIERENPKADFLNFDEDDPFNGM